jgi:hypothetical protein
MYNQPLNNSTKKDFFCHKKKYILFENQKNLGCPHEGSMRTEDHEKRQKMSS